MKPSAITNLREPAQAEGLVFSIYGSGVKGRLHRGASLATAIDLAGAENTSTGLFYTYPKEPSNEKRYNDK